MNDPIKENTIVILVGYTTYCTAELCNVSSVISILSCGIMMSHFMHYNMSEYGRISTGITLSTLSSIAEGFLFIFLGMSSWSYISDASKVSLTFITLTFFILFVGRFGGIYLTSALAYIFKRKTWAVNRYELCII